MRIHYFQHLASEGLGTIETWLTQHGYKVTGTHWYEAQPYIPKVEEVDWLIVMGGSMNVDEEEKYPWLKTEKQWIKKAIAQNKKILGICLGSQLIARALDAAVYRNTYKEIGWFPVNWTKQAQTDALGKLLPKSEILFHWHGDTFDLPVGAVHLAQSTGCEHQAFSYGPSILGLQFHLETTPEMVAGWIADAEAELATGQKYVQSKEAILANSEGFALIHRALEPILEYFSKA